MTAHLDRGSQDPQQPAPQPRWGQPLYDPPPTHQAPDVGSGTARPVVRRDARPALVMVAGAWLAIGGLISLVNGGRVLTGAFGSVGLFPLLFLAAGALTLYAGIQVMNLRASGRTLGMVLLALGLLMRIFWIAQLPAVALGLMAVDVFGLWILYHHEDAFS